MRFFTSGTLPAPLDPNTRYFVLADGLTTTKLKVSRTANGTPIDFTSTGNGDQTIAKTVHACLCKPKTEVAAEMRDYILQALKELVGQWADVYTAQFMQYNPDFKTTYGFPAGFQSVQDLSDHHFHFGTFSGPPPRSAGTIAIGSMRICRSSTGSAGMSQTTIGPIQLTRSSGTSACSTDTTGPTAPARMARIRSPQAKR